MADRTVLVTVSTIQEMREAEGRCGGCGAFPGQSHQCPPQGICTCPVPQAGAGPGGQDCPTCGRTARDEAF